MIVKRFGWVAALALLDCATTTGTPTGAPQTPRTADCDFDVLTAVPLTGYKEVGTVDVTPGGSFSRGTTMDLREFKKQITADVCKLGGDAAMASANGFGEYMKATVLKRVDVEPAPAAQASAEATRGRGCEFDTQCKGDRICVGGQCQAPTSDAASPVPATDAAAPKAAK